MIWNLEELKSWIPWLTLLVPLFGPLIYRYWRLPLLTDCTKTVESLLEAKVN